MSCILRVIGKKLNIDELLAIDLETDSIWREGEATTPKGTKHTNSGASYLVSDADFDDFELQKTEAIKYLNENKDKIIAIMSLPDFDEGCLDFGIEWRKVAVQCDFFPPELIKIAGELGLGNELLQYPPGDDNAD